MRNTSTVLILFFVFVVQGCSYRNEKGSTYGNEPRICDDGQLNHIIVEKFLTPYFNQKELIKEQFFVMSIGVKHDSLFIYICPILQNNDSIHGLPVSYISYGNKCIFIRRNLAHSLPIDEKSDALIKYREAINSKPICNTEFDEFPLWQISIKNKTYVIHSSLYPLIKNRSVKFHPPVIPREEL